MLDKGIFHGIIFMKFNAPVCMTVSTKLYPLNNDLCGVTMPNCIH